MNESLVETNSKGFLNPVLFTDSVFSTNRPTQPQSPKHRALGRSISGGPPSSALSSTHEPNQGDASEMKPFNHPDKALQDAYKYMGNEDWYVLEKHLIIFCFCQYTDVC